MAEIKSRKFMMNVMALMLILPCLFLSSGAEFVFIGNQPSTGIKSLEQVQSAVIILNSHKLVNGTLQAFHISTTGWRTQVRLQIWREVETSKFMLVGQIRHQPFKTENYSVIPYEVITVEQGDYIGFVNEGVNSVIAHDFAPSPLGNPHSKILLTSMTPGEYPAIGETYTFDIGYNIYLFGISVIIDTEYGVVTVTRSSSTNPTSTLPGGSPSTATHSSTSFPTTSPTEVKIGNPLQKGETLNPGSGSYILSGHDLPDGVLRRFFFYSSGPGKTVILQIWRPTNNSNNYTLVYQQRFITEAAGRQMVHVGKTVFIQNKDKLGFTNPERESVIEHTEDNSSVVVHRPGDNTTLDTGQLYLFNSTRNKYKFSINVVIDRDTTTYTTGPMPSQPVPAENVDAEHALGFWLAVIVAGSMAIITIVLTCVALCYINGYRRKEHKKAKRSAVDKYDDRDDSKFSL